MIGVTDDAWATFLRDRRELTEANFWMPSPRGFRALSPGEPFLFKTHWPHNRLVGGGFFSGYAVLTIAEAWEIHGLSNGVASMEELARRLAKYRREVADTRTEIGCVLLRDIFFTPETHTLPAPQDFAKNVVTFKGYDLTAGSAVEAHLNDLLDQSTIRLHGADGDVLHVPGPTQGLPKLTIPRVGQDAFKSLVLTSYRRRCAITGNKVEPVLQAAHIRPIARDGRHRVDNGLLLRSDVHILFDRGYLGIDEGYRLHVSRRLRDEYGNGDEFYARSGQVIALPDRRIDRPSREAVTWHMDTMFLR